MRSVEVLLETRARRAASAVAVAIRSWTASVTGRARRSRASRQQVRQALLETQPVDDLVGERGCRVSRLTCGLVVASVTTLTKRSVPSTVWWVQPGDRRQREGDAGEQNQQPDEGVVDDAHGGLPCGALSGMRPI